MMSMEELKEYYDILCRDYQGSDNIYEFVIENLRNGTHFAFARFNDGEMMGIEKVGAIAARGDQFVNQSLHDALIEAIRFKMEKYFIGIPCNVCFEEYHKLADSLVGNYEYRTSAVAFHNRNWPKFIKELPNAIKGRNVRYISGNDQDITFLTDVLGLNIVDHLKCPRINTWGSYDEIHPYINRIEMNDVVLLSVGPTARVLVRKWFEEFPHASFIDIGSIFDPFTRGVRHNYHKGWEFGFNIGRRCSNCN